MNGACTTRGHPWSHIQYSHPISCLCFSFGPGPHEVKLTVDLQLSGSEAKTYDIVIELAPFDLVPHAIHLFLQQVDHGLFDNLYFYYHGDHVLQLGPKVTIEEEEAHHGEEGYVRESVKVFQDMGLDTLAFPEYNEQYPHTQWTVGYAGRPGGPDFYINLEDNTEHHGPGGQYHRALVEQGDSCFGRIKSGIDVVEILEQYPYDTNEDSEWEDFFLDPVPITKAVILTPKPGKQESNVNVNIKSSNTPDKPDNVRNNAQTGQSLLVEPNVFETPETSTSPPQEQFQ